MVACSPYAVDMAASTRGIRRRLQTYIDGKLYKSAGLETLALWCAAAGCSPQNLRAFINSEDRDIGVELLLRLCSAGRLSAKWLLFEEGDIQSPASVVDLSHVRPHRKTEGT